MPKKTVIFHLDAKLADMFFRIPWIAPAAILPIALFRYFTFGKNFQEFTIWAIIAFLIPGIIILFLNSINNRLGRDFHMQIDSQGILYLTQNTLRRQISLQKVMGISLSGISRNKQFFFKMSEGEDFAALWPYEITPEDIQKLKDSLKVFGTGFKY